MPLDSINSFKSPHFHSCPWWQSGSPRQSHSSYWSSYLPLLRTKTTYWTAFLVLWPVRWGLPSRGFWQQLPVLSLTTPSLLASHLDLSVLCGIARSFVAPSSGSASSQTPFWVLCWKNLSASSLHPCAPKDWLCSLAYRSDAQVRLIGASYSCIGAPWALSLCSCNKLKACCLARVIRPFYRSECILKEQLYYYKASRRAARCFEM